MLSIGLVFVFELLLVYLPYFGGPIGIDHIPRAMLFGKPATNEVFLLIVITALALAIGLSLYLRRSWMGLAWESIRENELAAQTLGINPARFKLYAFMIGAALSGLGGVLYAHFIRYVTPYDFGFLPSVYVLVMVVFGGLGTVRGAVFGACFLNVAAGTVPLCRRLPEHDLWHHPRAPHALRAARLARRGQLCLEDAACGVAADTSGAEKWSFLYCKPVASRAASAG